MIYPLMTLSACSLPARLGQTTWNRHEHSYFLLFTVRGSTGWGLPLPILPLPSTKEGATLELPQLPSGYALGDDRSVHTVCSVTECFHGRRPSLGWQCRSCLAAVLCSAERSCRTQLNALYTRAALTPSRSTAQCYLPLVAFSYMLHHLILRLI